MVLTGEDRLADLIDRHEVHEGRAWTIGELARDCDVTLRALRFYEAKKLLRPARESGVRQYGEADRHRLKIIVRAKNIGFTLVEIRDLLELIFSAEPAGVRRAATLDRVRRQAELLEIQRHEVETSIASAHEEIAALERRSGDR